MAWTEKLPSGKYRGMYRLPNGEKRSIGTFPHKKAARDAAIEAEGKIKQPGWRDPRIGETTWSQWFELWWASRAVEPSTKTNELSMIEIHIRPRWGDVPLASIKRHEVQAWLMSILQENIGTEDHPRYRQPSTARRILNSFVSSLTAAVDAEIIIANPALRMKLPPNAPGTQVFLTREQYAKLSDAADSIETKAIFDFLVGTGVRWGEFAGLHLHNLDLETGFVTIADVTDGKEIKPYPKGRRARRVPIMQWSVDHLEIPDPTPCGLPHRGRKNRSCPSGLVFSTGTGAPLDDRNFSQRFLGPALKRAGLDDLGFSLHDFRHTYASWLVQDGVPLARIAELLGHASITTTEIYAHFAPVVIDDIRNALPDPRGANVGQTAKIREYMPLHATT